MSLLLAATGGSSTVRPYTETYTRLGLAGVSAIPYGNFAGRGDSDIPAADTWGISWNESVAIDSTTAAADTWGISWSESAATEISDIVSGSDTWGISWTESAIVDTAAVEPEQPSGGFISSYDLWRAHSQRRRKQLQDDEEQALEQTSADAAAQEIARFLHEQAKRDAQRDELARLRALVLSQPLPDELNEKAREAFRLAQEKKTTGAMLALSRAIIRQQEEEHFLITAALMFDE